MEKDNDNQIFIKDHWLHSLLEVVIEGPKVDILEKIKITKSRDKEVVRVVEEMKMIGVKVLKEEEWQVKRDIVLKERKIYIPKDKVLKVEIIWLYYDVPVAGYEGK